MGKRVTPPPGAVLPTPDPPEIQEAVRLIREDARLLFPQCLKILGDVTAYPDPGLLWMLTRMHFGFLDSLVRLVGVPRGAAEDWPVFVREARWFADPRNGADVRRIFAAIWLSGADLTAFRVLLMHFLCCGLVAREIRHRLEQRKYSEAWQEYISNPPIARIPALLRQLTEAATVSVTTRTGARKAVPLFTQARGVDDASAVALASLATLDAKQRKNLRPLALDAPPTVGAQLPGHSVPSLDAALPDLFAKAVDEFQAKWLPVLEGTMEKGPFAIHAAYNASKDHAGAAMRTGLAYDLDSLLAPPASARASNAGEHRQALGAVEEYLAKFPPQVREAIRLHRLEGMTQEQAAKEAGTSVETLKKALDKLAKRFPPKDR
jgi:hypothetical protein